MNIFKLFEFIELSYNNKLRDKYINKLRDKYGDKYDYSDIKLFKQDNSRKVHISNIKNKEDASIEYGSVRADGLPNELPLINKGSKEYYIDILRKKYGDKYDYSDVYIEKIKKSDNNRIYCRDIKCNKHDYHFDLRIDDLHEIGCPKCSRNTMTVEDFVKRAKEVHGDKYDYSLVDYKGVDYKVNIICKKHKKQFSQTPFNHLSGQGCPICQESKGEKLVAKILDEYKIKYIRQHKFPELKNKRLLPFDFYLPDYNICIEYDGIQHFEPIKFFKGEEYLSYIQNNDKLKTEYCAKNNIPLLRLTYEDRNSEVKTKILDFLQIKESLITKFSDFKINI